jgi:hypothetical protein
MLAVTTSREALAAERAEKMKPFQPGQVWAHAPRSAVIEAESNLEAIQTERAEEALFDAEHTTRQTEAQLQAAIEASQPLGAEQAYAVRCKQMSGPERLQGRIADELIGQRCAWSSRRLPRPRC